MCLSHWYSIQNLHNAPKPKTPYNSNSMKFISIINQQEQWGLHAIFNLRRRIKTLARALKCHWLHINFILSYETMQGPRHKYPNLINAKITHNNNSSTNFGDIFLLRLQNIFLIYSLCLFWLSSKGAGPRCKGAVPKLEKLFFFQLRFGGLPEVQISSMIAHWKAYPI